MPRVEVGFRVIVVAGRVVLHQTGGIEPLGETIHGDDPLLRFRQVSLRAAPFGEQAPRLVEQDPAENGRMVEITVHHAAQGKLALLSRLGGRLAPAIRHVAGTAR